MPQKPGDFFSQFEEVKPQNDFFSQFQEVKPAPTFGSRAMDFLKGMKEQAEESFLNPIKQARFIGDPRYAASTLKKSLVDEPKEFISNFAADPASGLKQIPEAAGIPISNLQEDWRTGSVGAGAADLAQAALAIFGTKKLAGELKAKPTVKAPEPFVRSPVTALERITPPEAKPRFYGAAEGPAVDLTDKTVTPDFLSSYGAQAPVAEKTPFVPINEQRMSPIQRGARAATKAVEGPPKVKPPKPLPGAPNWGGKAKVVDVTPKDYEPNVFDPREGLNPLEEPPVEPPAAQASKTGIPSATIDEVKAGKTTSSQPANPNQSPVVQATSPALNTLPNAPSTKFNMVGYQKFMNSVPQFKSIFDTWRRERAVIGQKIEQMKETTPGVTQADLDTYHDQLLGDADAKFIKDAKANGWIKNDFKKGQTRTGQVIDPNKLPGNWRAAPQVRDVVENYLGSHEWAPLKKLASATGRTAGIALSGTITPKVPLASGHGFNMLIRSGLARGLEGLKQTAKSGLPIINDFNEYFKQNREVMIEGVEKGDLNLTNPDYGGYSKPFKGSNVISRSLNWLDEKQNNLYRKPLFEQMIPQMMIEDYKALRAKGVAPEVAGKQVNATYGHPNLEALYRNKNFQNVLKSVFFAPSWLQSGLEMGNMKLPRNRAIVGRAAALYTVANLVNYNNSGHFMWDNDPGREFDIDMGAKDKDTRRYFKFTGTALDIFKVPANVIAEVVKGNLGEIPKTLYNKASVPARLAVDLGSGEDYRGRPLVTQPKDVFGRPVPFGTRLTNTLADASQLIFPSVVKAGINYASDQDVERGLVDATQSPFVYSRQKNTPMFQFKKPSVKPPKF